jgi:hypothetical protein
MDTRSPKILVLFLALGLLLLVLTAVGCAHTTETRPDGTVIETTQPISASEASIWLDLLDRIIADVKADDRLSDEERQQKLEELELRRQVYQAVIDRVNGHSWGQVTKPEGDTP